MSVIGVQPSLEQLVELFARAGVVEFERDNGGILRVTSAWAAGASLHGTAARMRVVGGMELTGRIEIETDVFAVKFVVERAAYDDDDTARVQLRAVEAWYDGRVERVPETRPIRGRARLIAVHCHDLKDGETVIATVEALSAARVVLSTHQMIRRFDVLELRARFGGELLDGEVQVVSVSTPSMNEPTTIEVRFCDGKRGRVGQVSQILEDYAETCEAAAERVDVAAMRRALEPAHDEHRRSLFSKLRMKH